MFRPIYLDHNASTPILPDVLDAMLPYLKEEHGNPSSSHAYGRVARDALKRARVQVAALIGAESDEILFTSGGTEASNLAIRGLAAAVTSRKGIVTSRIEHPATLMPVARLIEQGRDATHVTVDESGRARVEEFERAINDQTVLVTLMHSNNETGVLQPVRDVARIARRAGAFVHTDGAQSVGKVALDVNALGVDLMTVAGHKMYAPKGVGALYVRRGTPLVPVLLGAGHERGLRPGTENVASIVGLGAACEIAARDVSVESARVGMLRDRLGSLISSLVPGVAVNGHLVERLPNTLSIRFPRVSATALLAAAPEVAASTGSACHDGLETASSVILAMGVSPDQAVGSVRLTLGRGTTDDDIHRAADALARAWRDVSRPA